MAKTKEELNEIKKEVEALNKKLAELTDEELAQVSGGLAPGVGDKPGVETVVLAPADFSKIIVVDE